MLPYSWYDNMLERLMFEGGGISKASRELFKKFCLFISFHFHTQLFPKMY